MKRVTVQPAIEPLTIQEVKEALRVRHHNEDRYIDSLLKAARMWTEEYLSRALITQTIEETFDCFPRLIELSRSPLQTVSSLEYYSGGAYVAWDASNYIVDNISSPGRIQVKPGISLPSVDRVVNVLKVTYVAGYGSTAESVPGPIIDGIQKKIGSMYCHRQDVARTFTQLSHHLLAPYRVWGL